MACFSAFFRRPSWYMFCGTKSPMLGRLPFFDYYRPTTLAETLTAMERLDGNLCVLAGGTDLLVAMKERRGTHPALLDIKAVPELAGIRADNGTLCLGATVTTRAVAASPLVRERVPVLCQSLKLLGSMQIGNRATIGGNLSNGSPASDSAPPLLALGASVKLVGKAKERWVPLDNFFIGPKKTVIEGELLVEVRVPASPGGRGIFYKLGPRNAPEDICIVSAAVYGVPDGETGAWKELRIALGAVAPTPIRARIAEERLKGQPLEPKLVDEAARIAADKDAQPISDIRGSADYRREMVYVLVKRALEQIARDNPGAT
ncbi:MAG: xanthine dehydrogenase family protein subunit M [Deltaproteobacteria bacterium]|nr:xanthine dehydrogenase family protein subunit M [Deltaproteobacteria bacterium]MDZ4340909.1 xanthine dehydrogenase family protein subunit M [Candidatus Binatia bacterium]